MKKTIVLIRGWASQKITFNKLQKTLPKDYTLHIVSPKELVPNLELESVNTHLIKYLDKKGIERCILIGHSLGGALALYFASHNPKFVEKLILVDSAGVEGQETVARILFKSVSGNLINQIKILHIKVWEAIHYFFDPVFQTRLGFWANSLHLEKQAKEVKVPTAIIWGENDYLISIERGKKLHSLIPHSELIILKDFDHDWIVYNPETLWKIVEMKN